MKSCPCINFTLMNEQRFVVVVIVVVVVVVVVVAQVMPMSTSGARCVR